MKYFSKCAFVVWGFFLGFPFLDSNVLAEKFTSSVKGLLVRSLFENDLELLGKPNVSINLTEILRKDVPYKERSATSRMSDQSYDRNFEFPDGFLVPSLETDLLNFKTFQQTLNPINEANKPVLIQMIEWRGIIFLAQCYESICEIFKGATDLELKKEQTISTHGPPVQVKFYSEHTHLYVVIVGDVSEIYRWEETYFDELQVLQTKNSNAVEIMHSDDRVIMVFAQQTFSKVFFETNNRMKYVQNLDCSATDVVKYNVDTNHGQQQFILMLSKNESSKIYWWNRNQFIEWSNFENFDKLTTAFQAEINEEPFIFLSNKNVIAIYHAQSTNLALMRTLAVDGEVTSLKVENSKLVFLLTKPSGDRQILIVSFLVSKEKQNDDFPEESPINCLQIAFEKLTSRRRSLDLLRAQKKNLLISGKLEILKNVTVFGKSTFNNAEINEVVVYPENTMLHDTPSNIKKKLTKNEKEFLKLKKKVLQLTTKPKNITIQGLLQVKRLFAKTLNVTSLNGEVLDMDNYLSYDQNESKSNMKFGSLIVKKLKTSSLNNRSPNELLQRNSKNQVCTGGVEAINIYAENVKFGEISSINNIKIHQLVSNEQSNITGLKQFSGFYTEYLNASQINNVTSERFIEKVLPSKYLSNIGNQFHTDNLDVNYLNVENINSLPWEEYMNQLFGKNYAKGGYDVTYLNTKTINGIAVEDLLNRIDNQNILSELYIKTLNADRLKFKNFNNGSFARLIKVNEGSRILINKPVRIIGNLNASNIHFENPLKIGNISMDVKTMLGPLENENFTHDPFMDLSNSTAKANEDEIKNGFEVTSENVIRRIVIKGDLSVKNNFKTETINGENPATLFRDIFIIGRDNFTEMQKFSNLVLWNITLAKVNGVALKTSENTSYNDLSVSHIIFKQENNSGRPSNSFSNMKVEENFYGKVNDVDFSEMSELVLSKSKTEDVSGHYEISNLNVQSLKVSTINDVSMDSLIINNNETVTIYSNLTLKQLIAYENLNISSPLFQCPIEKVKNMNFSEVLEFDSVEAVGDISWEENNKDSNSVSSIFLNAVSKSGINLISSPVIFKKAVEVNHLETHHDINNINMSFIANDAVLSSKSHQTINCKATLKNVSAGSVYISSDLSVDSIGGVDIIQLDKRLVKKSKSSTITGLKNIQNGLKCFKLKADTIHGTNFSNLVFLEDLMNDSNTRVLPPTKFKSLDINYNMTVDYINGFYLDEFTNKIISLSKDENITEKFVVNGNLQADKLEVAKINDVRLNETVLCSGNSQTIEGKKSFYDSVLQVKGDIKAGTVHGNDLISAFENSLKTGENATINNNVVFEKDLIVNGNLNSNIINNCNISKLYKTEENFSPKYIESVNRIKTKEEHSKIKPLLVAPKNEKIFKSLENHQKFDLNLENIQSSSTQLTFNNTVNVEVYGMSFDECGLKSGCMCPKQYTFKFGDGGTNVTEKNNRTYHYYQETLNVVVRISTNSVSYKTRCQASDVDEITELSYATGNDSYILLHTLRAGYLSDVKFFRLDESIYIILAFLYNGKGNDTHKGKVLVFELQTSPIALIENDELKAAGAMLVDVIWASPSYILTVANLRSNDTSSESVYSQIYYFNEKQNKFTLMKNIRTHGVTNLKAVRMGKESFIFFVQKTPWPLLAFKYSIENENFYFSEKLYRQAGFYSVNSLALSDDPTRNQYISVVFMDSQFEILKYKHIEGLGEETTVKQEGVQLLQYFTWKSKPYLLAVSAGAPSYIYQVIVQSQ